MSEQTAKYQDLIFERDGAVAVVTLNRPNVLNALSSSLHKQLFAALREIEDDPNIRAVILTGAGRGFCAGDDMKESDPRDGTLPVELETEIVWHNIVRAMRAMPKPIIAAVNGIACGAGSGLVLGSDIRIASDEARFADIFIRRGIAGGAYLLTKTIGPARSLEMIMTGDIIDAHEAHRLGIFNRVVPAAQLMPAALELASRLAQGPALALALSKTAVYEVQDMDLDTGLRVEEQSKLKSLKSKEVQEGIIAFVDKRSARF
jgi:2-(1,2-epoxy-1,2-dihydrophenyl)acetyl-CoA isomerase